ncbi:MAG: FtsX-like permease family protein [Betaproteobacteria bacterium]
MYYLKLIVKNVFRAKLRSSLTIIGLVIAIVAFGLLQTVVDAWFAGSNASSASRMVTRNAISLVFPMPTYYRERMRAVNGVKSVTLLNWFGGIYKEPKNFFPQFAVDHENFFDLYSEFLMPDEQLLAFKRDRQGAAVGRKLADEFGWKIGDTIPIRGTIFPGTWNFTLRAIFDAKDETTVTRQMYFHWDYINEYLKQKYPRRTDQIGTFVIEVNDPSRVADIAKAIDAEFKNSLAETLTESEKSFQLGFIAQMEQIILTIRIVSFVVIFIIMAVVANTMAMTARERLTEYATLKALGFSPAFVAALIFGEAIALSLIGGGLGILLTFPLAKAVGIIAAAVFAVFKVSQATVLMQLACALVVGVAAALVPSWRSARIKIVDGLRHVG